MITYATDENFREVTAEGFVIVDFYQDRCGPCKILARQLEDIEDEMPFVNIVKVNTDLCPKITEEFEIGGVPDVYFFKDGQQTHREVGLISGAELRKIIQTQMFGAAD